MKEDGLASINKRLIKAICLVLVFFLLIGLLPYSLVKTPRAYAVKNIPDKPDPGKINGTIIKDNISIELSDTVGAIDNKSGKEIVRFDWQYTPKYLSLPDDSTAPILAVFQIWYKIDKQDAYKILDKVVPRDGKEYGDFQEATVRYDAGRYILTHYQLNGFPEAQAAYRFFVIEVTNEPGNPYKLNIYFNYVDGDHIPGQSGSIGGPISQNCEAILKGDAENYNNL
ncbi:hypothetical protein HYW31_02545, partial [Candidatus Berkelbacteria bacterium]|nr:hypothetical protein [Candidatus Berkelbacteria bacterium]